MNRRILTEQSKKSKLRPTEVFPQLISHLAQINILVSELSALTNTRSFAKTLNICQQAVSNQVQKERERRSKKSVKERKDSYE